jgi:hypothetical protein
MPADYPPHLIQLLTLGEERVRSEFWRDYTTLGITAADVSALIRIATDMELNQGPAPQHWAPLHAWRALAQFRSLEAVEPLIDLLAALGHDDYLSSELPTVFQRVGPAAIPALREALQDEDIDRFARAIIGEGIGHIGVAHPERRQECAAIIAQTLANFAEQDDTFNGLLVSVLMDLRAVEHAALLEQAFASEKVDLFVAGDWEDVQVELGLIEQRRTIRKLSPFAGLIDPEVLEDDIDVGENIEWMPDEIEPSAPQPTLESRVTREKRRAKQKSRRKQAKASKRRNRKR